MDGLAHAIADPVRRRILEALAVRPLTAGEIAAMFPVSRPAVSRHLRVLRENHVLTDHVEGRHRVYTFDVSVLRPLTSWIAELDRAAQWEHRFDALATEVHRTKRARAASTDTTSTRTDALAATDPDALAPAGTAAATAPARTDALAPARTAGDVAPTDRDSDTGTDMEETA